MTKVFKILGLFLMLVSSIAYPISILYFFYQAFLVQSLTFWLGLWFVAWRSVVTMALLMLVYFLGTKIAETKQRGRLYY